MTSQTAIHWFLPPKTSCVSALKEPNSSRVAGNILSYPRCCVISHSLGPFSKHVTNNHRPGGMCLLVADIYCYTINIHRYSPDMYITSDPRFGRDTRLETCTLQIVSDVPKMFFTPHSIDEKLLSKFILLLIDGSTNISCDHRYVAA
jgi:hypothetical protein